MFTRCVLVAILVWAWVLPHGKSLPSMHRTSDPRQSCPRGGTKAICSISLRYRKEVATKIEMSHRLRDSLCRATWQGADNDDLNSHVCVGALDSDTLYRLKSLRR
jgi:hypothetical protein